MRMGVTHSNTSKKPHCTLAVLCWWPLHSAGLAFMVGTDLDGQFTLRVAVGQSTTQLEHVQRVWATIQEQAGKVLAQQAN